MASEQITTDKLFNRVNNAPVRLTLLRDRPTNKQIDRQTNKIFFNPDI